MKKVIFGSALMICGAMGLMCAQLRAAIYFASPNNITMFGSDPMQMIGITLFIAGAALALWGFAGKE